MITALLDLMATGFQAGNPAQMATVARAILASIPDDIVALHFLGLAFYQMGRMEAARRVFSQACAVPMRRRKTDHWTTTGEMAATTLMREASTPAAGLGQAWRQIARAMRDLGFRSHATRAYEASLAARGLVIQGGTAIVPVSGQAQPKPE
jgi:cytochrome c-type biogenesis protein CcmH/NrfG